MSNLPVTPQSLQQALLRPCVLEILRAAGFQSAKPSVANVVTDMAARYLQLLAQTTAQFAASNHDDFEISITDLRMAMEEIGALEYGKSVEDQIFEGVDDISGVDEFIKWCHGPVNREIKRIAKDNLGEDGADYISALKKKQTKMHDDTRYHGTVLGQPAENRPVIVEGGPANSIQEWHEMLRQQNSAPTATTNTSRRASSALSSLGDDDVEMADFERDPSASFDV